MTGFAVPEDQRWAAEQADLRQRVRTLETQVAYLVTGAVAVTSATHPANPAVGMQIYETDTGLTAIWTGSAWQYPPQLVGKSVLGASAPSISVNVPSGIFGSLHCTFTGRQDSGSGGAPCFIRLNGDSGSNYTHQNIQGQQTTASAAISGAVSGIRVGVLPGSGDTSGYVGMGMFEIGNASAAAEKPVASAFSGILSTTNAAAGVYGGLWTSTAAVTSIALFPFTGNLVAGSSLTVVGLP